MRPLTEENLHHRENGMKIVNMHHEFISNSKSLHPIAEMFILGKRKSIKMFQKHNHDHFMVDEEEGHHHHHQQHGHNNNGMAHHTAASGPPQRPVLQRYEVGDNIFEVPTRYQLQYAIGQGAYGIVW